ncbi:MAG: S8 family serine peptidase, partial [Clostridia bacterium]|nr:S8 family serine peptidase [Clostridia bacterium]
NENTYVTKSVTSMAAPVVTGVASLVWSVKPDLSAPEVKRIVCRNTADTVEPSPDKYFTDIGYRAYPMVNAKLAVEAAILQKGGAYRVSMSGYSDEEVVFTNAQGDEFVFETDITGKLECVLPEGTYTVASQGVNTCIEINKDTTITVTVGG